MRDLYLSPQARHTRLLRHQRLLPRRVRSRGDSRAGHGGGGNAVTPRQQLVTGLAARVVGLRLPHPTRVAIDGVDAAGKTVLAEELDAEGAAPRRELRGR